MEKFKFERDGITKECHLNEGVEEQLIEAGWKKVVAKAAAPKAKPKTDKKDK